MLGRTALCRRCLQTLLVLLACSSTGVPAGASDDRLVPQLRDLREDAAQAKARKIPILLLFGADYCAFCKQLKESLLIPMQISGDYEDRIIIRELKLDSYLPVTGLDGRPVSARRLASRYRVSVTPTIVLLDGAGREVATRLVGVGIEDYYGIYLDESIALARTRMRARSRHLR